MRTVIDLNADLGEGMSTDAELMSLITSANIGCGAHAGNVELTARTLELAESHGVAVGAHPGYPDREQFGRREWEFNESRIVDEVTAQIGSLIALARLRGIRVRYLKPHGALYNQACREQQFADLLARVALFFSLPLIGLPGSQLAVCADERNVPFFAEGFADRRYQPDGSLVPRSAPNAYVHDSEEAVQQVEWLIREKGVRTICIHGDNPAAVIFAQVVREALLQRGYELRAFT